MIAAQSVAVSSDMSTYCRVCLQAPQKSQLLDLHLIYDEDEQLTYCDCFRICTQIELRGEDYASTGLPHNLCKSCGLELQMAYDFYKKVEDSKRSLQQQLQAPISFRGDAVKQEPVVLHEMQVEALNETTVECDEMEEHLDMEEFGTMEELDDDDAETIQIKIDITENDVDGEEGEYTIETIRLDEQQDEASSSGSSRSGAEEYEDDEVAASKMSWQQAVVAVANESHLPLKNSDNDEDNDTDADEEQRIEMENELHESTKVEIEKTEESESNACRAPLTTATRHTSQANRIEITERKRYTGKYNCDFCDKEFPNYSRMSVHRRTHEADRPKWSCVDCGRLYATKQAMAVHIRSVHTKTAGHICPICQKIYAIKKGLEIHMRYHNGDFPYVCDLCGKKFAQMSHLNTHKNVKHNSVRYCCDYPNCGKFFTSSASLRNHEFTHGQMPFECEFCQRGYPAKSKLKVHIKLKHGQVLTLDQMEHMRKFHVKRSKLNLVKVLECED